MLRYYEKHKVRLEENKECPLILYESQGRIVELVGKRGESEMDFLERMESIHSDLADVDELFLKTIGQTKNHIK